MTVIKCGSFDRAEARRILWVSVSNRKKNIGFVKSIHLMTIETRFSISEAPQYLAPLNSVMMLKTLIIHSYFLKFCNPNISYRRQGHRSNPCYKNYTFWKMDLTLWTTHCTKKKTKQKNLMLWIYKCLRPLDESISTHAFSMSPDCVWQCCFSLYSAT